MKLWRLKDQFTRLRYYESEKSIKTQLKKLLWEYERDKDIYSGSPWYQPPSVEQVVNDEWVSVKLLANEEIDLYFDKRHDKEERMKQIREEYEARRKAADRALVSLTKG